MSTLLPPFLLSLLVTYISLPSLIKLAVRLNLLSVPEERSSHQVSTPFLGGIAIFGGTFLSVVLFLPFSHLVTQKYILGAYLIIFMLGARDDVDPLTPSVKMMGQLLVSCILIFGAGIRLTGMHGMFGLWDIPEIPSILLTVFTIIVIINAVNLIDGIDALCSSFGLLAMAFFGSWFYFNEIPEFAILAAAMSGALVAFLRYNFSPARIFMGDTGSLFIGLTCAIMAITFIETNANPTAGDPAYNAAPAIAMAVLLLPLSDLLRVFFLRMLEGASPFVPDRKHLHHILSDLGLSHIYTSGILLCLNIIAIIIAVRFHTYGNLPIVCTIFGCQAIFSQWAAWKLKRKNNTHHE